MQVEVDDDDEAIGDDGDDGYNPNDIKIKSGVAKGVLDQVRVQVLDPPAAPLPQPQTFYWLANV